MKTRITIYAENDKPMELLGNNAEEKVRAAWEVLLNFAVLSSEEEGKYRVENVEVWD